MRLHYRQPFRPATLVGGGETSCDRRREARRDAVVLEAWPLAAPADLRA
jgi:hypothetical protein